MASGLASSERELRLGGVLCLCVGTLLAVAPQSARAETLFFEYSGTCQVSCVLAGAEIGGPVTGYFSIDDSSIPLGFEVRVSNSEILELSFDFDGQIYVSEDIEHDNDDTIFDNDGGSVVVVNNGAGTLANNGSWDLLINLDGVMKLLQPLLNEALPSADGEWLQVPEPSADWLGIAAALTLAALRSAREPGRAGSALGR
jgi:hypothetical protein